MQILNAKMLLPRNIELTSERHEFVRMLCDLDDCVRPQKYGYWEPLRLPFQRDLSAEIVSEWGRSLYVTRRKPRVDIDSDSARGGSAPVHADVSIRAESGRSKVSYITEFAMAVANSFTADFGLIHVIAEEEYANGLASETMSCYSRQGKKHVILTTHDLRRSMPDLYWGTLFGPPYIELFGESRLLSSPAPLVRKLDYGAVYLQLSESPYDFVEDYARLEAIRSEVKRHLGENAFFSTALPQYHKYDVPTFHLDS